MKNISKVERQSSEMCFVQSGKNTNSAEKEDWDEATLRIRRVNNPDRGDEAQILIQLVSTYPSGRSRTTISCMHFTPEEAQQMSDALLNPCR